MRILLTTCLLLLMLVTPGPGQSVAEQRLNDTLTGVVLDADTREPVIGATVRAYAGVDSTTAVPNGQGAITNGDGRFILRGLASDAILLDVYSLGYARERVPIRDKDGLTIALAPSSSLQQTVEVRAVQRTRSVEDACCRVESIREEVQQHAPFAPSAIDVLRRYSSCTSTRIICAADNAGSVRLRGLEPTNIALLIDGVPAISGLGTMYGMGMIPSHALQTVRIAEGASSGLYGNGAVSGVLDLQLRVPTEEPEFMLTGTATGDGLALPGERDLNASWTGLVGDVGVAAFASVNNHRRTDGLIPGAYDRYAGLIKANVMTGPATELTVSLLAGSELREGSIGSGHYERTRHRRTDASARLAHSFDEDSELIATALLSDASVGITWDEGAFDGRQRILYAGVQHALTLGDHDLTVGAEARDDRLRASAATGVGYVSTVVSAYAQDEMMLSDAWSLLGSVRVDHHSVAGAIVSPRGSIRYEPIANMTMRLMAGRGFKGDAHFIEEGHRALHGGYRWEENPDFGFERSFTLNYDISYRFATGDNAAFDVNWTAYHTSIEGKATPFADSLAASALFMINSPEPARLIGTELQVRPTLGDHWSAALGVALVDYSMKRGDEFRPLPLVPSLNVDLSVMYQNHEVGFTAEVWGSHVGSQTLPEALTFERSDAYTLLNIRAEKTLGPVAIFAGVQNILDKTQTTAPILRDTDGYNASTIWGALEGREVFVGGRLAL